MSPAARSKRAREEAEQQCHDWRRQRDISAAQAAGANRFRNAACYE